MKSLPIRVALSAAVLLSAAPWAATSRAYSPPPDPVSSMPMPVQLPSVTFTDIDAGLPAIFYSDLAWGDFDDDGDLDLVMTGSGATGSITGLRRNDGGAVFTDIAAAFPAITNSSATWGDFDNDGDLDLALTGLNGATRSSRIYRNDGDGVFTDIAAGLPGVYYGSAAWGDYDNDGDLDLALMGYGAVSRFAGIFRNDGGGVFTDIAAGFPGAWYGAVAWADYDNDGDMDLTLMGDTATGYVTRIYRNDGGDAFTDIAAGLPGLCYSSLDWGDFDGDGDLDLALAGYTSSAYISRIYRNDGSGVFADIAAGLLGVVYGSLAWGDFDNDGHPDLGICGYSTSGPVTKVYWNYGGGTFLDFATGMPGVYHSSLAWGDYDNDGDLDLAIAGDTGSGRITRIYRSDGAYSANAPPAAPTGLTASAAGSEVTLSWNASTDDWTPQAGLSYNVRVITPPGGSEAGAAMADAASGYRRVSALGNAQQRTSWTLTLPQGMYYFQVQAVDAGFAGSPFSAVGTLPTIVGVPEEEMLPAAFALRPGGPNPFGDATSLSYDLPRAGEVRIDIFDVQGRHVRTLVAASLPAGRHHAGWDGTDSQGCRAAAGAYLCRMRAGAFQAVRRVVLIP